MRKCWPTMDRRNVRALGPFFFAFLSADVATQVLGIAVAWHVFTLHHRPFDLGLVGLTLFLPAAVLVLVTGLFADRHDRRSIVAVATAAEMTGALAFLALVLAHGHRLWPYLAVLLAIGTARAFGAPAERGMLLALVPESAYLRVTALYSAVRQVVAVGGPALGGALVAAGTPVALGTAAVLLALSTVALLILRVPPRASPGAAHAATVHEALGGLRFIRAQPVILGAISLDLFAVLFGGATALLPAYADSILHAGPVGLGFLRSAPAAGAALTAGYLARRPLRSRVGRTLLVAVAIFGVATIVFGLSRNMGLSFVALTIAGGSDMVSVVIRSGLVQLSTPDAMRGRVNAVENVFIGASNELGAFESGTLAAFAGVVPAVVAGGAATLAVVAICVVVFPQLRQFDRFGVVQVGANSTECRS
jgi:MFS family permease